MNPWVGWGQEGAGPLVHMVGKDRVSEPILWVWGWHLVPAFADRPGCPSGTAPLFFSFSSWGLGQDGVYTADCRGR